MVDVTDATFRQDVIERSMTTPVVVDLWATWCGPCKTLGPIIEKVVAETNGAVTLAKVDVDANPQVSQAFGVQSIPAVFAIVEGKVVDSFVGAKPEHEVRAFVSKLAGPASPVAALLQQGDEASLTEALRLEPNNADVLAELANLWLGQAKYDDVEILLGPHVSVTELSPLLAQAKLGRAGISLEGNLDERLGALVDEAVTSETAKEQLFTILDALGSGDPRYVRYRRALANRLY